MVACKLKVVHAEEDSLHLSPTRKNINDHPGEENSCGDDSIIFLPYDGHLCHTVIADNIDFSSNKMS